MLQKEEHGQNDGGMSGEGMTPGGGTPGRTAQGTPDDRFNEDELLDGKSTDIDNDVHKKDLGEGRFGNVITVKNKLTRYQYAMKIIKMPNDEVLEKIKQTISCVY